MVSNYKCTWVSELSDDYYSNAVRIGSGSTTIGINERYLKIERADRPDCYAILVADDRDSNEICTTPAEDIVLVCSAGKCFLLNTKTMIFATSPLSPVVSLPKTPSNFLCMMNYHEVLLIDSSFKTCLITVETPAEIESVEYNFELNSVMIKYEESSKIQLFEMPIAELKFSTEFKILHLLSI
jgi:hypothetical protein